MWRIEEIRLVYKPLRWVLVGFLLVMVAAPVLQKCVVGLVENKGCQWQTTWGFIATYYPWILSLLLVLVGLLIVSWRAERSHHARQRFDLLIPSNKLRPEDLNFHVVDVGKSGLEEMLTQSQRPFHERAYIPRMAIPYHVRGRKDPEPWYTEDELARLLKEGKGFILQGPPTEGKSRTLYEVIKKMDDYEVVSPKADEIVSDDDIRLLLKGRKIVLLLEDLTKYVGSEVDLHKLGNSLTEHQVRWVVASACRDGPGLDAVRNSETRGLKSFYEDIREKLELVKLTAGEKRRLAQNIGKEWEPAQSEHYATPGSITMEEYKRFMRERFDRDLSLLEKDTLRALKLLSQAGVLPFTHRRVKALLEGERLFDWSDVHLRRDCLDKLREYAFLGRPPVPDVVQPEPAYLADDVVRYIEGREPEQDFEALMHVLEELEDGVGLFYLGNTYYKSREDVQKGLEAYDAALKVAPNLAAALSNKGTTLVKLGRPEEAIEAYDAALEIRPNYAEALLNKTIVLLHQERTDEAIATLCRAWRQREYLPGQEVSLAQLFTYLGKEPGQCP